MNFKSILLAVLVLSIASCEKPKPNLVLEVTTFNLKTTSSQKTFNELDAMVESNFTIKQPGFIKRQSAVDKNGNYMVIVYWNTLTNAKASMDKFMTDASVADYAGMIEGATMKMNRFNIHEGFTAENSDFIEVMEFNLADEANLDKFNKVNEKVAVKVTAPKEGFVQRVTGANDKGEQVVVVYWDTEKNSDAALQPFMSNHISKEFMGMMDQPTIKMFRCSTLGSINTPMSNKDKAIALLNSFNTGDTSAMAYVNSENYIQHNLGAPDGAKAFEGMLKMAPDSGFKAKVIRAFEDGDYVFTHSKYNFFGPKAGFDVFRFEDGLIVEHWDNMLEVQKPNPSGHTQFDGSTVITDLDQTDANKGKVKEFVDTILLNGEMDKVVNYINPNAYVQHNPAVADGLSGFGDAMTYFAENGLVMEYETLHKVLGQGNFVLTLSEGKFGKAQHTAYYDLFRLEDGLIVEHWDVIAPIPQKSEWKNKNGKF
ncbi:nuclear transport factor 2 family protein [Croceitalea marina]|uniref:Nuclear transport factor 2 family protein n=1 Tax=Croceitalea marina TaxID=1775166 RepID=A0ABW5MZ99_9FLAO